MGKNAMKLLLVVAVALATSYAYNSFSGGRKKGGKRGQWARRLNGERWQPQGVQGPMNQSAAVFAPPLAPVNP